MRFGIISTSRMAEKFARTCALLSDIEVASIASRQLARAIDFKDRYSLARAYGSYEELCSDPDIDAVYVATPHNFHKENCLCAIKAGKHVLCEKSLTLSVEDAEEIFTAAAENDVFVMEAVWTRFLPTAQKAMEWVDSGRIGKIKYMDASSTFCADITGRDARLLDRNLAGGALYELGVYCFYMTQCFDRSDIVDCNVMVDATHTGVDGFDLISVRLADGVMISMRFSINYETRNYICVYGDKGYILMTPQAYCPTCVELYERGGRLLDSFKEEYASGFEYEISHFTGIIRNGMRDSGIMSRADIVKCCEFYEMVRSKWTL